MNFVSIILKSNLFTNYRWLLLLLQWLFMVILFAITLFEFYHKLLNILLGLRDKNIITLLSIYRGAL